MATPPQVPPPGAPPQGGAPSGASGMSSTGQVLQLIAIISKASDQLSKVFPAAAPMADAIQNQLRMAQQKIAETQSQAQPQAPPI